jgi:hypothetical protein
MPQNSDALMISGHSDHEIDFLPLTHDGLVIALSQHSEKEDRFGEPIVPF